MIASSAEVIVEEAANSEADRVRDLLAIALKACAARVAGPGAPVREGDYAQAIKQFRTRDLPSILAEAGHGRTIGEVEAASFPVSDIVCRFKYHVLRRAYAIALAEHGHEISLEAYKEALPRAFHEVSLMSLDDLPPAWEDLV